MAWTTPRTWTVGEIVTASMMNSHVRDNLRYLKGLDGAVTIEDNLTVDALTMINTANDARLFISSGGAGVVELYTVDAAFTVFRALRQQANTHEWYTEGVERMRVTDVGRVGIGTASPQDILHAVKSPGGFLVFCRAGIGATPVQITTGASRRIVLWGVAHRVSGGVNQAVSASSAISGGTADIYTDGGANILRVTNTAGTVTVARAAGSDTFDVVLFCAYQ